jgi:hypothetical protein
MTNKPTAMLYLPFYRSGPTGPAAYSKPEGAGRPGYDAPPARARSPSKYKARCSNSVKSLTVLSALCDPTSAEC